MIRIFEEDRVQNIWGDIYEVYLTKPYPFQGNVKRVLHILEVLNGVKIDHDVRLNQFTSVTNDTDLEIDFKNLEDLVKFIAQYDIFNLTISHNQADTDTFIHIKHEKD